jgi:hypothetical protein
MGGDDGSTNGDVGGLRCSVMSLWQDHEVTIMWMLYV